MVAKNSPGARTEAKNAVLDVLKDGQEWKMNKIMIELKPRGFSSERIRNALKDLKDERPPRVRSTRKGYWNRTKDDLVKSEARREVQEWKEALAEAYRNGPYETMQRHSARILIGLMAISHHYGGRLEDKLLVRDLTEMGAFYRSPQERNPEIERAMAAQGIIGGKYGAWIEPDSRTGWYWPTIMEHIKTGYPEANEAIEKMEKIKIERKKSPPPDNRRLGGHVIAGTIPMEEFDLIDVLEMDEELARIVAEVMAGSILKGECSCCPPVKGLMKKLKGEWE